MAKVGGKDEVTVSSDEYLRLIRESRQNKYLKKALKEASDALWNISELIIEHSVLKGHSEKLIEIRRAMIIVDNILKGTR